MRVLTWIRRLSVAEAVSYLVLLVAAIVKRSGGPEFGVDLVGPIHGVLYLVYVVALLKVYGDYGWPFWRVIAGAFLGAMPFGGFWVDRNWLAPLEDPSQVSHNQTSVS